VIATGATLEACRRVKKLAIYARERVGHAWLVDPVARTLEGLHLEGDRWTIVREVAVKVLPEAFAFDPERVDLKPANVKITPNEQVKVLNFGCSIGIKS
jgi:hypothetical protein